MRKLTVDEASVGLRADVFVARELNGFSRSLISKLFETGDVLLDGTKLKPGAKLKLDQNIEIDDSILFETPPKIDIPIIYQDKNVIVVNKPAGVLTHAKGGFNNEATVASFIADKLDGTIPKTNKAGIVHRLDRATSGVMICARNELTQKFLQKQFAQRKTKKTYFAVVEGKLDQQKLIIDAPITRNPKQPQSFTVNVNGKSAQTVVEELKLLDLLSISKKKVSCSLLELKPTTGRTHQLRVHLKYISHPIVGDNLYGGKLKNWSNLLLHAAQLELTLPGGVRKVFNAPLPEYFP